MTVRTSYDLDTFPESVQCLDINMNRVPCSHLWSVFRFGFEYRQRHEEIMPPIQCLFDNECLKDMGKECEREVGLAGRET